MITKFPNTISTEKIMTVVFSYSFLAITYESHTQFYTRNAKDRVSKHGLIVEEEAYVSRL